MSEKKKILHLVEAFGGGVFTFLVELANATCEDYDVVIAYSKRKQTPENFKGYFNWYDIYANCFVYTTD